MTFVQSAWLFAAAITLHNLEEAIWLPDWSRNAGRWHHAVGRDEFRFAVLVLTLLAVLSVVLAIRQGKASLGAYLVSGYALAMLLNVLVPHVVASLVMRRYMPGTATAVLLNLPVTLCVLIQGFREGYIDSHRFAIVGPAVVVSIIGLIPLLFWAGRRLQALP